MQRHKQRPESGMGITGGADVKGKQLICEPMHDQAALLQVCSLSSSYIMTLTTVGSKIVATSCSGSPCSVIGSTDSILCLAV